MSAIGEIDYREFYKNHTHFLLPPDIDSFKDFFLGALDICITTKCSLHCRGCAHLMHLHKKRKDYEAKNIISAMNRIFDNVKYIARINLIGGEPFLYNELPKLMSYLSTRHEQFGIVKITTNGTIIPKRKEIYDSLHHPWAKICISNYQVPQSKANQLKIELDKHHIQWTDTIYDLQEGWYDFGSTEPRHRTQEELKEQYSRCDVEWLSLYNDKIYACPRAAQLDALGLFDASNDSVDVYSDNFANDLWEFTYDKKTHDCCDRCNLGTTAIKHIPPAEQIQKESNRR